MPHFATLMVARGDLAFVAASATTDRLLTIGDASAEPTSSDVDHDLGEENWRAMQTRLDREDEAEGMYKLWCEDAAAWLERAKETWRARHLAKTYARAKALNENFDFSSRSRANGEDDVKGKVKGTRKRRPADEPFVALSDGTATGKVTASLTDLIQFGLIKPGKENVFVVYQENAWIGDLARDGTITFRGREFTSPSAWAIYAKRLTNPTKKADDGWKSVRYSSKDGPTLDQMKAEYGRLERLKSAGAEVNVEEAANALIAESIANALAGGDAMPRSSSARKRKASDVAVASATDEMSWIDKYPGCVDGASEPYPGAPANENMDFTSLIGRDVCVRDEELWWCARVIKIRDYDTHIEADLMYADGRFRRGVDLEELAGNGDVVIL